MKPRLELEIRLGRLLDQTDVEGIVFPTNSDLMLIGDLGAEILRSGGIQIEREARQRGPIGAGEATHSTAGELPFRCIILAAVVGPGFEGIGTERQAGTFTSGKRISEATLNALDQAHILGLESVAMPPIGVAEAAFPVEQSAEIMLGEIQAFAAANPEAPLRRVVIACPDRQSFAVFDRGPLRRLAS
ncbi:MAG: macro domain-containing protein [Acidobacteria bacterium]|nr:macro domain-containing protein [Acidobacteriota bacterium]